MGNENSFEKIYSEFLKDLVNGKLEIPNLKRKTSFTIKKNDSEGITILPKKIDGKTTHSVSKANLENVFNGGILKYKNGDESKLYRYAKAIIKYLKENYIEASIPEEIPAHIAETLPYEAMQTIIVDRYERNPQYRKLCIDKYSKDGTIVCEICGFDFGKSYDKVKDGFIHIHHEPPISEVGEKNDNFDPEKNLFPVCPNCHAMLHREKGVSVENLKAKIKVVYSYV
jgi:hypothetical protein